MVQLPAPQVHPRLFDGYPRVLTDYAERFGRLNGRYVGPRALPRSAVSWDDRERELWLRSRGSFHPRDPALWSDAYVGDRRLIQDGHSSSAGRVSVVTPTTESRRPFHGLLWVSFDNQDWPDKELVVVDTYCSGPSSFLMEKAESDSRLTYIGFDRTEGKDFSIGLKRNIGTQLASGEFIAHFDDDDFYAPRYLSTMVGHLRRERLQAVTLSDWYILDVATRRLGYVNPVEHGRLTGHPADHPWIREQCYGYGFSYVYCRDAALEVPFGDFNMGEDFDFCTRVCAMYGGQRFGLREDANGICLHSQHRLSTSNCLTVRTQALQDVSDLDVALADSFLRNLDLVLRMSDVMGNGLKGYFRRTLNDVRKDEGAAETARSCPVCGEDNGPQRARCNNCSRTGLRGPSPPRQSTAQEAADRSVSPEPDRCGWAPEMPQPWKCTACDEHNSGWHIRCIGCDLERPDCQEADDATDGL